MLVIKRIFTVSFLIGLLLLAACSSQPTKDEQGQVNSKTLSPEEAIALALVAKTDEGVEGVFKFKVIATGSEAHNNTLGAATYFLNSEKDYRSEKCLTVRISPPAAEDFKNSHGMAIDSYLKGKTIIVHGTVKRVKIIYKNKRNGKPTGRFYYQNHILVNSANQIDVVNS